MSETIICALISAAVTLLVSIGTWQVSVKKDREKAKDELRNTLEEHYQKTQKDIEDLRDDISDVKATVQSQISIMEVKIENLTKNVEKHNQVIERTFKLEQAVEDLNKRL